MTWETIKMTCKQPWFLMCFAFSVESIIFLKAYFKFRKIQLHFITSILWIMGCMLDRPSLMIHASTYMPFSTYHHMNDVIIGHFKNVMIINLLFTLLKNILPPTDLQLALCVSTHFLAIFQGAYSIQFVKGSPSKEVFMPLFILSILSYFSQSIA